MTVKNKKVIYILLLILLVTLTFSGFAARTLLKQSGPQAVKGVLDLRGWDFSGDGVVSLKGEWEFYWSELLSPGQFGHQGAGKRLQPTGYIMVPSIWSGQVGDARLTAKGYGTYRLVVKLPSTGETFGIKTQSIRMAHNLFVNGILEGHKGIPAAVEEEYTASNVPYITFFTVAGDEAEIIIQVANHSYTSGGIAHDIYFGEQTDIIELEQRQSRLELIVFSALFFIGIYHLGIFFYRPSERSLLYLGLYCLVLAIAQVQHGQRLFGQFLPDFPFELLYKIKNISLFMSVIFAGLFLKEVGGSIIPDKLIKAIQWSFGIYSLAILALPLKVHSVAEGVFVLLEIICYFVFTALLIQALRRDYHARINKLNLCLLCAAFFCIALNMVEGLLFEIRIIPYRLVGDVIVINLVMFLSLMLAVRFSDTYDKIEALSEDLVNLDKLKDEFLTNTTHELKTPLHGIINISQAMLESSNGTVTKSQANNLRLILSVAQRLSHLINDIMDFSKLKHRQIELNVSDVDIRILTSLVLEVLRYSVDSSKIQLVNDIPEDIPYVTADEDRVRQVLFNVIGNAVKFTRQGQITVSAEVDNHWLIISVSDTGIGIAPDKYESIFESFEQLNSSIKGTGIGLTISRQIVELLGGHIGVAWSEPGKGTCIAFSLPISATEKEVNRSNNILEHGQQAAGSYVLQTIKPKPDFTILAVDDDVINLQVILNVFASENYSILTATSGSEALRILETNRQIDLVLLDVMMPDMTGYELCRKIREEFTLLELPVIMVTVQSSSESISTAFSAGANDFIIKPFEAQEVRARTKTILALKKALHDTVRAEMAFLQSQIKPHFLYNALNTIRSFCYSDGVRAGNLLAELGNFLHKSFLLKDTSMFVSVESELELVQSYIELEKGRFGERLKVVYSIDNHTLSCRILPLTIQPLVENAIQHGLMKKEEGGTVTLSINKEDRANELIISVSDDGIGMNPAVAQELLTRKPETTDSVGLLNIHRRMSNFYGQGITIESLEGEGTKVTMRIPAQGYSK